MEYFIPMLRSSLYIMIPILFASIGGLFTALTGKLNIALEGLLIAGAFSSFAVYYFSGNLFIAIISAIISAVILSALHVFAVFKLRSNLFISGLAINLLSGGLCIVLSDKLFNTRGVVTATSVSGLINWYLFFGIILLFITWVFIYKTPFGYRLRACEKNSDVLISLGINPKNYQIIAILISGFFCGMGGAFLSLNLGIFLPGISAGKGWISLAVIFLGIRKPVGILAAAFIFAFAESFSNFAQGFFNVPADFILAFPFLFTLIVMVLVSVINKK